MPPDDDTPAPPVADEGPTLGAGILPSVLELILVAPR